MFTPQWRPWTATERKGKAVAFSDDITTPSPPKGIRREGDGGFGGALGSTVDDWRKFKEVGLLDEASLEKKDRDALIEKNLKLEKELFDYQHNMGLLLIEKKKWTSTNEELQQAFDEAGGRTSNLIALNEAEKREENLRKTLISEKQFVAELEKDLKYWQQEHSEVKSTSEAKLAEANALVMGIKEKALEGDRERAIAEENLSVINRKSSELERKLKDVETREKVLQREHLSLATEREAHEAVFYKQREDLQEWEKKLTVEENRLSDAKRSINHIEERTTESERIIKKKEKVLEEMQKKIDNAKSELKEREESLNIMLNDISMKEKDFEAMKTKVDMKEKELHELEEKLIVREQIEIGKLLDDQKAVLDSRRQEFEMELEQMRISLDEELEKKKGEIEQLQVEISHKEGKLVKRELALEKLEEKVKDLEGRLKAVKEKEQALKAKEKKLHMENERFLEDKGSLRKLKVEIVEIGAETVKQESRIRKNMKVSGLQKEERLEFLRAQSKLSQQIDIIKQEEELLLKEREELNQDKGRFEKEWEALDEKKADISREQKEVTEEKEKLRSLQISEKHRLKREEITSRDNLKMKLDDVKMQKKSFEVDMEIKKLALHENAKNKTSQLVEELEKQRKNLDMELQRQEEEGEKDFNKRPRTYEKRSQEELDNINNVKKLAQKVQYEKLALQREREKFFVKNKKLDKQLAGLLKGANKIEAVRIGLKEHREELYSEKMRFVAFLEKFKLCNSCGELFGKFVQSHQPPEPDAENSRSTSSLEKLDSVKLLESSQPVDDTLNTVASDDHESSAEQSFADRRIQPRRGRDRSKSVRGKPQATKAASRDLKPSDGEISRKRQREQASRITESEHAAGDSDAGVDSITTGGRRKKRQTAVPVSQTPGQSRYHLDKLKPFIFSFKAFILLIVRRHRNVGTEEDKAQTSTGAMGKQDSVNGDIRTVPSPKDNLTPPQAENRENIKAKILVEAVTHDEIVKVAAETEFKDKNTGKRPVEDPQLEAGGSGERRENGVDDEENFSMSKEENEEKEFQRPGEASIGKKIWVFFTT